MAKFFSYEGRFSQVINKAVDIVVISFLWLLCCLPVFTVGASTTALFTAVRQVLRENRGYSFRNFFTAFKSNFKQSTGIWMIFFAILFVLTADRLILVRMFLPTGSWIGSLHIVFTILTFYVAVWAVYTFAYAARFEQDWKGVMKNGAILSIVCLPWSLLMAVMLSLGVWVVVNISPIYTFIFPAAYAWIFSIILERVFRRIMTEEDREKVEEEDKLNK